MHEGHSNQDGWEINCIVLGDFKLYIHEREYSILSSYPKKKEEKPSLIINKIY